MKHGTASQSALGPGTGSPTGLPSDAPTSPLRPGPGYRAPKGVLHRGLLAPCCSEGHHPTHPTKVPVPVSDPKALGLGQPGFVAGQTREFSSLQHCRPASRPVPCPWGAAPHLRRSLETSLMNEFTELTPWLTV